MNVSDHIVATSSESTKRQTTEHQARNDLLLDFDPPMLHKTVCPLVRSHRDQQYEGPRRHYPGYRRQEGASFVVLARWCPLGRG